MNAAATADWQILGFADDGPGRVGSEHYGIPILCTSGQICDQAGLDVHVHLAIGDNRRRGRLARQFEEQGLSPATLVHQRAETAPGHQCR